MKADCSRYREQIPRGLIGDLAADERRRLQEHIHDCAECRAEHAAYRSTVEGLEAAARGGGVPVPRHFFVNAEESSSRWQRIFGSLGFWRTAAAGALGAALLAVALLRAGVEVRNEAGAWTLRLGRPAQGGRAPERPAQLDAAQIEARVLARVEERLAADRSETVRLLRVELDRSRRGWSGAERAALDAALTNLETRVNQQIALTADRIEGSARTSLTALYESLDARRRRDVDAIMENLNQVARTGEIKNNQTDAILDTLIQAAELRLDRPSR
jgi:anti-sigma-K factor RskA